MHVLRHTVWEREDDVLVKRVHGTLFYTTLQAIPTGTSASTFASIITTNALIALTPLVCHQERLFACKKIQLHQSQSSCPHTETRLASDKTHDITHFLMYLLPDVVKMDCSFASDHPMMLHAVISISYDVFGESPEIRCSNTDTIALSTSIRSCQSETGSTVSFTPSFTIT